MKKYIIIALCIVIILIGCIVAVNIYNVEKIKILSDDNKQVEALKYIYEDFVNGFNLNNKNLYLDDSCLKNFITGNEFDESNKSILKSIEIENEEFEFLYKITIKQNNETSTLTLLLEREDGGETSRQNYKIYVKNNSIKYVKDKLESTTFIDFAQ